MRYALRSGASESSRESVRAEASSCCLFMRNMSSQLGVYPVLSTAAAAAAAAAAAFAADDAEVFCELCCRSFRYSCTCFRPSIAASAFAAAEVRSSSSAPCFSSGSPSAPKSEPAPSFSRPSARSSPDHQVSSHDAKRVFLDASRSLPIMAAFSFSESALRCQESMLCRTSAPVLPMMSPTSRLCSVSEKCFSNRGHSSASSRATCVSRHTRTAAHAACRRRSTSFTAAFETRGSVAFKGETKALVRASSASPMPAATRKSRRHASRSTNSSASCSWSSVYECDTLCSSSLSSSAGNTSSSSLRLCAR